MARLRAETSASWPFIWPFALLLNTLIALVLRNKRKASVAEAKPSWQHRADIALGKPLYILIWTYGAYLAATPVLLRLRPEQGLTTLRHAMDLLFALGGFVALFWFLFRATRVLESHLAAWTATTPSKIDDLLVPLFGTSLRVIVVVVGIILGISSAEPAHTARQRHGLACCRNELMI